MHELGTFNDFGKVGAHSSEQFDDGLVVASRNTSL